MPKSRNRPKNTAAKRRRARARAERRELRKRHPVQIEGLDEMAAALAQLGNEAGHALRQGVNRAVVDELLGKGRR